MNATIPMPRAIMRFFYNLLFGSKYLQLLIPIRSVNLANFRSSGEQYRNSIVSFSGKRLQKSRIKVFVITQCLHFLHPLSIFASFRISLSQHHHHHITCLSFAGFIYRYDVVNGLAFASLVDDDDAWEFPYKKLDHCLSPINLTTEYIFSV